MKLATDTIQGELLFYDKQEIDIFDLAGIIHRARTSGKTHIFAAWHVKDASRWFELPVITLLAHDDPQLESKLKDHIKRHGAPIIAIACNWCDFKLEPD